LAGTIVCLIVVLLDQAASAGLTVTSGTMHARTSGWFFNVNTGAYTQEFRDAPDVAYVAPSKTQSWTAVNEPPKIVEVSGSVSHTLGLASGGGIVVNQNGNSAVAGSRGGQGYCSGSALITEDTTETVDALIALDTRIYFFGSVDLYDSADNRHFTFSPVLPEAASAWPPCFSIQVSTGLNGRVHRKQQLEPWVQAPSIFH
jgi:hypothetical protein